jgi:precorrin-6Y C5,15-methyltransferase (decarboxylating)
MITKQYKRDLALQYLNLEPNLILWDVGAGSGSCAIEAFKRYRVKTVLFEKQELRCEYIAQNLAQHNVIDTKLYQGEATEFFEVEKSTPDRIFVGGGGKEVIAKLPYLYDRLASNGILLMVAITLKNLTQMISILDSHDIEYEVISLSITTHKGKLKLIEPQREVFMIRVLKD